MPLYRVRIPAALYLDVEADNKTKAIDAANDLRDRNEEIEIPDFDTELEDLYAMAATTQEPITIAYVRQED